MVFAEANPMSVDLSGLRLPLAHFTLEVDAVLSGRVTGIFGASGAGKTSLLEIIAGLRRPVAGTVRVDGSGLTDVSTRTFVPPERRAVGYVPQEGALFPHLSVRENLLYGFLENQTRPTGLTFGHVTEILEVAALVKRRIQTLSGGEKQRVALGRALLASPRLLLLDEPLAGLDAPLRERLLPYLARVRDEFAIPMIYVTHSPDEVIALCDDVVILAQGIIEKRGVPAELFVRSALPRFERRQPSFQVE
jgi:molybdate transport system ATP-binding protein